MDIEILWMNALFNAARAGGIAFVVWCFYRAGVRAKLYPRLRKRISHSLFPALWLITFVILQPFRFIYEPTTVRYEQDTITFDRHKQSETADPSTNTYRDQYDDEIQEHARRMEEQRALSEQHRKSIQETQ